MADPLSITASVFGVSAAGFKVAQGFYHIADSIGSAGEEVRLFASDTDIFAHMLYSLSQTLEMSSTQLSPRLLITTEDAVKLCEQILQPFERIIARLNPLLQKFKDSQSKTKQVSLRIQWVFKHKAKISFYQRMLNSLKSTLMCLLSSMNLGISSNVSSQRCELLRIQVENARSAVQHSLNVPAVRLPQSSALMSNTSAGRGQKAYGNDHIEVQHNVDIPDDQPARSSTLISNISLSQSQPAHEISHDEFQHKINIPAIELSHSNTLLSNILHSQLVQEMLPDAGRRSYDLSSNTLLEWVTDVVSSTIETPIEQAAEYSLEAEEAFGRGIDEDLYDLPGPNYRSTDSIYEDVRSLQRKISDFTKECLAMTEALLPENNLPKSRTSPSVRTTSLHTEDEAATSVPYRSPRSDNKIPGLDLLTLREKNQILLEDTFGSIHYVPLLVAASWEGLKTFLQDSYSHHLKQARMSLWKRQAKAAEPPNISTVFRTLFMNAEISHPSYPSGAFRTEHGVSMRGDENAYYQTAFQRALERGQYYLEDRNGAAARRQIVFRKENWHERTWMNAQLLLLFENPFFNEIRVLR